MVGNVTSRKRSPKEEEEEEGRVIGGTCKVGQSFSFLRSNIILRNPICELGRRRVFRETFVACRRLSTTRRAVFELRRSRSSNKEYSPVAGEIDRDRDCSPLARREKNPFCLTLTASYRPVTFPHLDTNTNLSALEFAYPIFIRLRGTRGTRDG